MSETTPRSWLYRLSLYIKVRIPINICPDGKRLRQTSAIQSLPRSHSPQGKDISPSRVKEARGRH